MTRNLISNSTKIFVKCKKNSIKNLMWHSQQFPQDYTNLEEYRRRVVENKIRRCNTAMSLLSQFKKSTFWIKLLPQFKKGNKIYSNLLRVTAQFLITWIESLRFNDSIAINKSCQNKQSNLAQSMIQFRKNNTIRNICLQLHRKYLYDRSLIMYFVYSQDSQGVVIKYILTKQNWIWTCVRNHARRWHRRSKTQRCTNDRTTIPWKG